MDRVDKLEAINALLEQEKVCLKHQLNKAHFENDSCSLAKMALEQKHKTLGSPEKTRNSMPKGNTL